MASARSAEERNRLGSKAIDTKSSDYDQRMTAKKVALRSRTAPEDEKS
jgi:hypothetical protein